MQKNLTKVMLIGIIALLIGGILTPKKVSLEGVSNTTNLRSGYSLRLFDSPDTPVDEDKKTNDVETPKTGITDYIPLAFLGVIAVIAISLLTKNKVHKI